MRRELNEVPGEALADGRNTEAADELPVFCFCAPHARLIFFRANRPLFSPTNPDCFDVHTDVSALRKRY